MKKKGHYETNVSNTGRASFWKQYTSLGSPIRLCMPGISGNRRRIHFSRLSSHIYLLADRKGIKGGKSMLEASFLRAEQSYLTPPEYDDEKICECCGIKIPKGDVYFENDFHLLCKSCVLDKLYNEMQTA